MPAADSVTKAAGTARKSARKATTTTRASTRRATGTAKESASKAAASVGEAVSSAKESTAKAAGKVKGTTRKAVGGARATRKAKAGLVDDARQIAEDAGAESVAAEAIAETASMHYQVEVNKRGLSVSNLTKILNQRWDNGWRLAHILEQRGNTVLVFERRV